MNMRITTPSLVEPAAFFRHYETDYWLTCYKQAVKEFNQLETKPVTLVVHRVPRAAEPYAASNVTILNERTQST